MWDLYMLGNMLSEQHEEFARQPEIDHGPSDGRHSGCCRGGRYGTVDRGCGQNGEGQKRRYEGLPGNVEFHADGMLFRGQKYGKSS